jgi:hypothetical protein
MAATKPCQQAGARGASDTSAHLATRLHYMLDKRTEPEVESRGERTRVRIKILAK